MSDLNKYTAFSILCQKLTISSQYSGTRIDKCLSLLSNNMCSRTLINKWLKLGLISINGTIVDPDYKIRGGENIQTSILPPQNPTELDIHSHRIPFSIVYEDAYILVLNKEINCVVHRTPAFKGDFTMMDFVLDLYPQNQSLPRFGLVHRLDKDTSGLLIIAKTEHSYNHLIEQFKQRLVKRLYYSIVHGHILSQAGIIRTHLERKAPLQFKSVISKSGKEAITYYKVIKYLGNFYSLIECSLGTGRTHQIRAHMCYLNHPVVGDKIYYGHHKKENFSYLSHMLCAYQISFQHPVMLEIVTFQIDMPEFMKTTIDDLSKRI